MQTSEKKLGCLEGTKRANVPNIGTIEGSVNVIMRVRRYVDFACVCRLARNMPLPF